jgi:hypothetical protein
MSIGSHPLPAAMRLRGAGFLLALVVALPATSPAQLLNPTFDSDVAHWNLIGRGTLAHEASDGHLTANGALRVTGGNAGNRTQSVVGQCLDVSPSSSLDVALSFKVETGAPEACRLALFGSPSTNCRGLALEHEASISTPTSAAGWQRATGSFTTTATTDSLEVRLHCYNVAADLSTLTVLFDDVSVGGGNGSAIFSDGFETGDTSRWSDTIPAP